MYENMCTLMCILCWHVCVERYELAYLHKCKRVCMYMQLWLQHVRDLSPPNPNKWLCVPSRRVLRGSARLGIEGRLVLDCHCFLCYFVKTPALLSSATSKQHPPPRYHKLPTADWTLPIAFLQAQQGTNSCWDQVFSEWPTSLWDWRVTWIWGSRILVVKAHDLPHIMNKSHLQSRPDTTQQSLPGWPRVRLFQVTWCKSHLTWEFCLSCHKCGSTSQEIGAY